MNTRSPILILLLGPMLYGCAAEERPAADTAAAVPPALVGDSGVVAVDSARPGANDSTAGVAAPNAWPRPPRNPADPPRIDPSRSAGATADTVRGIIAEVGSVPMTSIVVRQPGARSITVVGPLAREIGRAAGADVQVSGSLRENAIEATAYAVRAVDGQPAVDGVIARSGDDLFLVTRGGRLPISRPPQALRDMIGARVWLVGPLDGTIASYGVLREP